MQSVLRLQGFDPLSLDFIRLAHEKGMGIGDPKQIEILGEPDLAYSSWGFIREDTFASRGQKMIYHGWLHPFEKPLLRSPDCAMGIFCQQFLPQCLLVSIRWAKTC